jgi:hypothetical protein
MAKLLYLLQDYLLDDHATLAALACTEKAAAAAARPLLRPLKPRWFLSFYGRGVADHRTTQHGIPFVFYAAEGVDEFPSERPDCGGAVYRLNAELEKTPGAWFQP